MYVVTMLHCTRGLHDIPLLTPFKAFVPGSCASIYPIKGKNIMIQQFSNIEIKKTCEEHLNKKLFFIHNCLSYLFYNVAMEHYLWLFVYRGRFLRKFGFGIFRE